NGGPGGRGGGAGPGAPCGRNDRNAAGTRSVAPAGGETGCQYYAAPRDRAPRTPAGRSCRPRRAQRETTPVSRLTVHADGPAVRLDDLLDHRQAEPEAAGAEGEAAGGVQQRIAARRGGG